MVSRVAAEVRGNLFAAWVRRKVLAERVAGHAHTERADNPLRDGLQKVVRNCGRST